MSVKTLTTEQLQGDLAAIARMWPDGVPEQQTDRVNAIKAELKRRGAPLAAAPSRTRQVFDESEYETQEPAPRARKRDPKDMTTTELKRELERVGNDLNDDPGDDQLQDRFADLRYELRGRTKAEGSAPRQSTFKDAEPERVETREAKSSVQARAIEIPDDVPAPAVERRVPRRPEVAMTTEVRERVSPQVADERVASGQVAQLPRVSGVKGYTASVAADGVLFAYAARAPGGGSVIQLGTLMSDDEVTDMIAMLEAVLVKRRGT